MEPQGWETLYNLATPEEVAGPKPLVGSLSTLGALIKTRTENKAPWSHSGTEPRVNARGDRAGDAKMPLESGRCSFKRKADGAARCIVGGGSKAEVRPARSREACGVETAAVGADSFGKAGFCGCPASVTRRRRLYFPYRTAEAASNVLKIVLV